LTCNQYDCARQLKFTGTYFTGEVKDIVEQYRNDASTEMEDADSAAARGRIFKYAVYCCLYKLTFMHVHSP